MMSRRCFALCSTVLAMASLSALIAVRPAAAVTPQELRAAVDAAAPEIIALRQQIHQHPELGNREHQTAALVAEHLRHLGFEVQTGVAHTGVVALLEGGLPGPVVAVRADMDALPVTEDTPLPFKSEVRTTYLGQEVGVSHACGHDVHTAVQLGVASVLSQLKAHLPGTVKLIFQPAEEGPPPGEEGGAELMLVEGALNDPRPSVIFGLHTMAELEVGKVGYTHGPAFAAVDHFIIKLKGRQAHGAAPHLSVDPIVMASQAVLALQTIRSRTLSPLEPSVITVGMVRGGERYNIIPSEVHLEGTVRTYSKEVQATVVRRMEEILAGISAAAGGTYELDYRYTTPATINDRELGRLTLPSLAAVVGEENLVELEPTMGGEDFAVFSNEVPGFYFRLGMVAPGTTSGGHHTPTFQADDSSVPVGMEVMARVLIDAMERLAAAPPENAGP